LALGSEAEALRPRGRGTEAARQRH
jgi:hypothetical protein